MDQEVAKIQEFLNSQGANLKVDGIPGPKTQAAIQMFQERAGLRRDGIVGPDTNAAIEQTQAMPIPQPSPIGGALPPIPRPNPMAGGNMPPIPQPNPMGADGPPQGMPDPNARAESLGIDPSTLQQAPAVTAGTDMRPSNISGGMPYPDWQRQADMQALQRGEVPIFNRGLRLPPNMPVMDGSDIRTANSPMAGGVMPPSADQMGSARAALAKALMQQRGM